MKTKLSVREDEKTAILNTLQENILRAMLEYLDESVDIKKDPEKSLGFQDALYSLSKTFPRAGEIADAMNKTGDNGGGTYLTRGTSRN
jgi:hypothetical protein